MAIGAMSPGDFEDLVFALVRCEHDRARQLGPPDAGRDTIVPLDDGTELTWQAKHHTAGIDWGKCEESLQTALRERQPREITFVFPVKMTATKESGLAELRERYRQVRICEPWTLPDLRAKLAEADDVRRELIDRAIGVDELHVRELLERAAARDEVSTEQTAAAMGGPVTVLGHGQALADAEARTQAGDLPGASQGFETLAAAIGDRMPRVANAMLLQAARLASEGNEPERAGSLYLRASKDAAQRRDDVAEFAAFRASWLLAEEDRWRSLAAMARASWPERPEESVPVLRAAFERVVRIEVRDDVLEWAVALCEALAAEDDWPGVLDVAERACALLSPVVAVDGRLELELERLTAHSETGLDVDAHWRALLLAPVGRSAQAGPLIRARWAMVLARRGRGDLAAEQFSAAAERWRTAGDAEDEVAEAILSEDVVAQALGPGRRLDQAGRIAVAELRGRATTPASTADRLVTQGLRAWLAGRGWEARGRLVSAWVVHRRAGHLAGTLRVAETLHDLFKAGEEWHDALPWAIRSGLQLATETAATKVGWQRTASLLRPHAPQWERGAMWESIAATGDEASDEEIATLTPELLEAASDHATTEHAAVGAASAARRALATVLCRVAPAHLDQALHEVVYETTHTPFPPRRTIQGMILATDAGVCDASELIAEVFGFTDRAHLAAFGLATELVAASEAARAKAVELATSQFPALLLCAWADLPDDHPAVAARAADVVERSLEGKLADEILRSDDRGRLARWASLNAQRAVAHDLLEALLSPSETGAHRHEAGTGLAVLAARLTSEAASELLDRLIAHQEAIKTASAQEAMSSNPNPLFARVKMRAPAALDQIRAVAVGALAALADRAGRNQERRDAITSALADNDAAVRAEAVRLAADMHEIDVQPYADDPDPLVCSQALIALAGRRATDEPTLLKAAVPDAPLALRSTVLRIAREQPTRYPRLVDALCADSHVYVRAVACRIQAA